MEENKIKECVCCISCGTVVHLGIVYEVADDDGRQFICSDCYEGAERCFVQQSWNTRKE